MGTFRQQCSLLGIFTLSLATLGESNSAIAEAISGSLGDQGIQASTLHNPSYNLIGRKIGLGQVEIGRPGKFGFDKQAAWGPAFSQHRVFFLDEPASPDDNVDDHAGMVASMIVSQDKRQRGVAPGARLYSAAVGSLEFSGQPEECLATQLIARQNSDDIRAINFSFGESLRRDPRPNPQLDGNALFTQCLDWTARMHDVLHVVAGNQGSGGIPIPTDQYNGITTAYTNQGKSNHYHRLDFANLSRLPTGVGDRLIRQEINVGPRRAISLSAPGANLRLINSANKIETVSGTSFAAPHITGTVAILQEYGDRHLANATPNWSLDARRHEVMKAVLLNSADKIKDAGNGNYLGMTRTVLSRQNRNWLQGDAYQNPTIPLDMEMGTGQLNAYRAYQQFAAGQGTTGTPANSIGWDYGTVRASEPQIYPLASSLLANSFVSLTLTWDRHVELNDLNDNSQFDRGESFRDKGLNNLDLYLLPAAANNLEEAVCRSISPADNTEHIFCPIPETGKYKIVVRLTEVVHQSTQAYGLTWWSASMTPQ